MALHTHTNDDTYDAMITRTGVDTLIPTETANEIIDSVPANSAMMALMTRLPNMSAKVYRLPVISALPTAYFVTGEIGDDTNAGQKQMTAASWTHKDITAEELAVIVPIPEAVVNDSSYDIWGQLKPKIVEAIGVAFDNAVLFGTNAPTSWPTSIVASCIDGTTLNKVVYGTGGDLADDIGGANGLMALVEKDGYEVTGFYGAPTMKSMLRGLRDAHGSLIFQPSMVAGTPGSLYGMPIEYCRNGAGFSTTTYLVGGDFKQAVYSIRQDITYKVLDQAVLQDSTGAIVYNLAQQDMVALRVTMRLGWQLPNPINRVNSSATTRYPFAALTAS